MVVLNDRRREVVSKVVMGADEQLDKPSGSTADNLSDTRRPWVAPTWERRDTPMEVTMYAGQR